MYIRLIRTPVGLPEQSIIIFARFLCAKKCDGKEYRQGCFRTGKAESSTGRREAEKTAQETATFSEVHFPVDGGNSLVHIF